MAEQESGFGAALVEGLTEAAAWRRGELSLEVVTIYPKPVDRIRATGSRATGSGADVERRFGIPADTSGDRERGCSRPDPVARLVSELIEADPDPVARGTGFAA